MLIQALWAEGGVGRFYKGFTPAILRAMPANGIMLVRTSSLRLFESQWSFARSSVRCFNLRNTV